MAMFAGPAMSIGSGMMGMNLAEQQRKMAQQQARGLGPAGQTQDMANQRMQGLMSGNYQNDPSYMNAQQAAARATSTQPGGAMGVAAANASNNWVNQAMQATGPYTGAPTTGNYGANMQGASDITSRALASLGYGVTQMSGGGTGSLTPQQQQALVQLALGKVNQPGTGG